MYETLNTVPGPTHLSIHVSCYPYSNFVLCVCICSDGFCAMNHRTLMGRGRWLSIFLTHLQVFILCGRLSWKYRFLRSETAWVEERALELAVKVSLVQRIFIEHRLYVPDAAETKECESGPLPSRNLHFCKEDEQVNK